MLNSWILFYWSIYSHRFLIYLFLAGVDLRGYLGLRAGLNVFGLLNWTVVRTFFTRVPWVPLTTFLCTFCAFWTDLIGAFFTFSSDFFSAVFLGTGAFLGAAAFAGAAVKIIISKLLKWCQQTNIIFAPKLPPIQILSFYIFANMAVYDQVSLSFV